jgi:hypothetical protein
VSGRRVPYPRFDLRVRTSVARRYSDVRRRTVAGVSGGALAGKKIGDAAGRRQKLEQNGPQLREAFNELGRTAAIAPLRTPPQTFRDLLAEGTLIASGLTQVAGREFLEQLRARVDRELGADLDGKRASRSSSGLEL